LHQFLYRFVVWFAEYYLRLFFAAQRIEAIPVALKVKVLFFVLQAL